MANNHTTLVNDIRVAISARGALVWLQHVGLMQGMDGKPRRVGLPGQADIGAIYRGRGLQIECKTGKGVMRDNQNDWRDATLRAGGVHVRARSVKDATDALDEIDRLLG